MANRPPTDATIEFYKTSDIHLAAYLKCAGYRVESNSMENRKVTFVFKDNSDLQRTLNSYVNREALVDPVRYKEEVDLLRNVISQLKSSE